MSLTNSIHPEVELTNLNPESVSIAKFASI
jgi:hypothetical protein